MQPEGSHMHACIERMSRLIQKETPILVLEAAMNGAIYPFHLRYVGKPTRDCNIAEKVIKTFTTCNAYRFCQNPYATIFSKAYEQTTNRYRSMQATLMPFMQKH